MQVVVGRIGRPHGVRGGVTIEVRTDDPDARFAVGRVLHTDPPTAAPLTVAWRNGAPPRLVVGFETVGDRDAALELRGRYLTVDSQTLPDTGDPDEFHDHQLRDLIVETADGAAVGTVVEVRHPGQDLLVIDPGGGGGELLVPFVKAIVPEVDLTTGRIVITPPPGLLDEEDQV